MCDYSDSVPMLPVGERLFNEPFQPSPIQVVDPGLRRLL